MDTETAAKLGAIETILLELVREQQKTEAVDRAAFTGRLHGIATLLQSSGLSSETGDQLRRMTSTL